MIQCLFLSKFSHVTARMQVSVIVNAPVSTIASIIGSKGKDESTRLWLTVLSDHVHLGVTLKQIRDQT